MEITVFKSEEFGEMRTMMIDGTPWFVGKDVATALGYKNSSKALKDNVFSDDKVVTKVTTPGGLQDTTIINESGAYALIFGSRLESAQRFKHWVTSEVLPQIRKTGGYIPIKEEDTELEIMSKAFLIAKKTLDQKDQLLAQKEEIIKVQDKKLSDQKPLVTFANQVAETEDLIDMNKMAKLLKDEHINIGRNRLYQWLRDHGYLMQDNVPYQQYIDNGVFKIKERTYKAKGVVKTSCTTYITGKGQIYLTNLIKKKYAA